jgi:1-acyl-sn-glycerol-3-phosphate acyltransferase
VARSFPLARLAPRSLGEAIDRLPNRLNALGYDAWGFHKDTAKLLYAAAYPLYQYFRPVIRGAHNVPAGRVLLVPNHAGQLPLDGVVIAIATLLECQPPRLVRAMVERWFPKVPFVNEAFSRAGAVLGAPINCRNLLEDDQAILVFPEGARGSGKVWKDRYRLRKFGRGFMRLALQTNTPIVPVSVVGSEETILSLYDVKPLARLLGLPYFPLHPLLPVLGPLAYLPLPARFYVRFGEPMRFEGAWDDEDAVIDQRVAVVQSTVQSMIDADLAQRATVFG